MKRSFCLAILLVAAVLLFVGCSSMGPNYDEGYYVPSTVLGENSDYQHDEVVENDFVSPAEQAMSTFALDRNTASYSLMRRQINADCKVSENAVRVEEYVNYFNYNYTRPTDEALALGGGLFDCPWNNAHKLFTIGVAAEEVAFETPKQNNIVFLIDTSGSMYGNDRLGLIQQSFTMLLDYLGDNDVVSIVTYAGDSRVALEGALGSQKTLIANVLQDLTPQGSTNGSGGIQKAYATATKYFVEGGNNRILLATDGDFNVGATSKTQLEQLVDSNANNGIYLSVLGVGMMNTNDSTLSILSKNGQYAYLDSVAEARKVLVEELGGTFNTVAKDAKIGVTFNENVVESYRLIGYENKMITEDEFNDPNKNAGEIGSGHTVTAVYEVQLIQNAQGEIATAEVKFKTTGETEENKSISKTYTTNDYTATPNEDSVFIGCVVEYGLLLRNSAFKNDATFGAVIARLESLPSVSGENADQFRNEFLQIVKKAKALYEQ
ncbi:MAG: von Willebrand factor type A domain-containing protein [Candidatus Fimimonas sp.]